MGHNSGGNQLMAHDSAASQAQDDYWTGKNGPPKTWYSGMGGVMTGGLPPGLGNLITAGFGMIPGPQGQVAAKASAGAFGGGGPSPAKGVVGAMSNQGGNKTSNTATTNNSNVQFAINNSGVMTDGEIGKSVQNVVNSMGWPGIRSGSAMYQG